ncbi:MAG TPA: peptidylprolyl isomerase [Bacteroidia bacterium]|nr:peptidylprolyl isomerase [Bacteroidia bacterium]
MTLLTKIRNRSGLLVTIIAIALLIFILESALESRKGLSASDRSKIAVINGKDVSIEEFQNKLDQAESNQKAQSQKSTIDENTRENLRSQVWNQILLEYVVKPRYEKIGVAVSEDELFDMVQGKDPHPQIKQAFTDQKTNQFNPVNVINFLKNMEKDETGDTKNRWIVFEQAIKEERISQKYTAMVKKGLYVTKAEAKRNYIGSTKTANILYIAKKYTDIPDSTITVNEDDLKKYYNENKNKYKQKETVRVIDYVEFNVTPSGEDRKLLAESLEKLKAEFAVAEVDSDFVNQNSDVRYSDKYIGSTSGFMFFDSLSRSPLGTVVGPYPEGNLFKIAKLSGTKMWPDSVKARHILLKVEDGKLAQAKERADSLIKAIKGGKKFDDLAKVFSKDPGSGAKGGDLGWFKEGMMVKPFNDACFNGKKGELQVVESQFGVHLIEVTDKGKEAKRLLVSVVERASTPSSSTYQYFYGKASEFAGKNNNKELFEKSAKEQGLNKRSAEYLRETDRNFNGIENAREVVRWAYNAKIDEVSPVFQVGEKYLVAMLTKIKEKGTLPLDAVKDQVEIEAKKQKKAEKYIAEFEANMKSSTSIEQLAQKMNLPIETASNQSFINGVFGNFGREASIMGAAYGSKVKVLSKPSKGDNAVFVFIVTNFTEAPASVDNYKSNASNVTSAVRQRVDYEIFEALKDKADIEDRRAVFY